MCSSSCRDSQWLSHCRPFRNSHPEYRQRVRVSRVRALRRAPRFVQTILFQITSPPTQAALVGFGRTTLARFRVRGMYYRAEAVLDSLLILRRAGRAKIRKQVTHPGVALLEHLQLPCRVSSVECRLGSVRLTARAGLSCQRRRCRLFRVRCIACTLAALQSIALSAADRLRKHDAHVACWAWVGSEVEGSARTASWCSPLAAAHQWQTEDWLDRREKMLGWT